MANCLFFSFVFRWVQFIVQLVVWLYCFFDLLLTGQPTRGHFKIHPPPRNDSGIYHQERSGATAQLCPNPVEPYFFEPVSENVF